MWRKHARNLFAWKDKPFFLSEGPGGILLFQRIEDNKVFSVGARSGRLTPRFSLGSTNDVVGFDRATDTLLAGDLQGGRTTKVLDSQTGRVLWETPELMTFIGTHASELFIFSGPSIGEGFERKRVSNEIQSISRTTGKITWKRPMPATCYEAVLSWPYLVLEDQPKLTVLAADTGTLLQELDVHDWVIQIKPFESQLVYTTRISRSDFEQDMVAHFCSLPELKEQNKITLKETEPGAVTIWRNFIITEGGRRTVCFRLTGEKVWEKGHMDRTDVIDGKIYFTDNLDDIARIGMIDVLTGVENILYTDRW